MASDPGDVLDPAAVVGLLAEPARLRALAALVLGARTLGEVAAAAGLGVPIAGRALDRLVGGGIVEETPGDQRAPAAYRVIEERLQATARASAAPKPEPVPGDASVSGNQVLASFFSDGRLISIPVASAKRRVVLEYLATRFEPGRVYPEQQVNFVLGQVHADYAALRRYLVDDGFLERRDGFYWRVGGTFDVD
ncbi:MAG TPA: DUF2087 domain-containing protein [Acidimicrobiales bacterium]